MAKKSKNDEKTGLTSGPLTFVPGKDVNAHRYFDTDLNMLFQTPYGWQEDKDNIGRGDAVLRTSRAYLTWGRPEMKQGILSCFRKFNMQDYPNSKYWYQGARCNPRHGEDDMSRDQLSGAFYALLIRGDKEECLEIIRHTPFKISRRFIMSPDFWLWTKAVQGKKMAEVLWYLFYVVTLPFTFLWNGLVNLILGYKEINQKNYSSAEVAAKHSKYNKFQKMLDRSLYPAFASHHIGWYMECLPNSFLKRCVQKILMTQTEKGNYIERLLYGDKTVTQAEVDSYIPMTEYRWSSKLDGNDSASGTIPPVWDTDLVEKLKINQLDKDMLIWLWGKKKIEWNK